MTPSISVIMVDGGFRENLWTVHSWLNQSLASSNYELIWVDYTDKVPAELEQYSNCRTVCLGNTDFPQKLSLCFNEGIRQAKGEIIILPDADVVADYNLLETIRQEITDDNNTVLYVLRLDQPEKYNTANMEIEYLRKTCSMKHTYNYGGCTAIHKKWLLEMNGYEQLPFFAGYHYNGGDNYIRFKNMGLKIKWHPFARVYHPWHPLPKENTFLTCDDQERFIRWRSSSWDWMAFNGLDQTKNRDLVMTHDFTEWEKVITERGSFEVNVKPVRNSFIHKVKSTCRRMLD